MTTKTAKEQNTNEVHGSGWWAMSEEQQAEALASLPDQDTWSFVVTRVSDNAWSLDLPVANTYGELLVNGTNVSLDLHYANLFDRLPKDGDQMLLTCSTKELSDSATVLTEPELDKVWEGSATYTDKLFGVKAWLCPFTMVLWKYIPDKIWIKLQSV